MLVAGPSGDEARMWLARFGFFVVVGLRERLSISNG